MAFRRPQAKRRFKILLFGEAGIGKTTTAVRTPGPVIFDMEDGTSHYESLGDFIVEDATDPDIVTNRIVEITGKNQIDIGEKKPFKVKTLVLDPIHIWELSLTQKLLDKRIKEERDPDYKVTLEDYQILKNKKKKLMMKLMAVDFNVIVCARTKDLYAQGEIMKKIGIAPDCDVQWLGFFDTIIYLYKDPGTKKRMGVIYKKDRTNRFPVDKLGNFTPFEYTYEAVESYLDGMDYDADVDTERTSIKDIEYDIVRNFETEFNGKKVLTAGVTGEELTIMLNYFDNESTKEKFKTLLKAKADVLDPHDLTLDMAKHLIEEMEKE